MSGFGFPTAVVAALGASGIAHEVRLVGSRARGTAVALSDWDFAVDTADFAAFSAELPALVRPLAPIREQWDRLSEHACYMLLLPAPCKVDLIFTEPSTPAPPWDVSPSTLAAVDAHFWDWRLWLAAKRERGLMRWSLPNSAKCRDTCSRRWACAVFRVP